MTPKRVVLLAGGWSSEREVSLNSGRACSEALIAVGHDVTVIDPAEELERLVALAPTFDAALILLHGRYGEDGRIQGLLDCLGLPYQGAGIPAMVLSWDKVLAKKRFVEAGLTVPPDIVIGPDEDADPDAIAAEIGLPLVVKPAMEGSTVGISFVERIEDLGPALTAARRPGESILVEPLISGKEITAGVLDLPDRGPTALPVIEIRPKTGRFFDYERKYTPGATDELCPAPISDELTRRCQEAALTAHHCLEVCHWSRTDMIVAGDEIYVLETNTVPGMTATSLIPKEAAAAGLSLAELLERLIELALRDRPRKS